MIWSKLILNTTLEGGWLENNKKQEDYIRDKLKNYSWTKAIDINKSYKNKKFMLNENQSRKDYSLNFKNTYKEISKHRKISWQYCLCSEKKLCERDER